MKLRGYAVLAILSVGLILADVVQRAFVATWVRLRPLRRIGTLTWWQGRMAAFVLACARLAGARIPAPLRVIPGEAGHLVLMNHQSVFDIPLVIQTIDRAYPRIVTRARYGRSIPLISHMVRLYQYPTVDPSAPRRELVRMLRGLEEAARTSDVPIAIFPEGTRSRDGSVSTFRKAGLERLLRARPWTVHVVACDGFWKAGRFADLPEEMGKVEGKIAYAGSLDWPDPQGDPEPLLFEAHRMMVDTLEGLRAPSSPS